VYSYTSDLKYTWNKAARWEREWLDQTSSVFCLQSSLLALSSSRRVQSCACKISTSPCTHNYSAQHANSD